MTDSIDYGGQIAVDFECYRCKKELKIIDPWMEVECCGLSYRLVSKVIAEFEDKS